MSLDKPGPPKAGEQTPPEREDNGHVVDRSEQYDRDDADLVLDVPVLNVDELDLEVEDLRAHVSVRAELADFVKVNVGVDVFLDKVKLGIKGVEAQAFLQVKLERVLNTLDRALDTIDRNPQVLGGATRSASQAAQDTERTAQLGEGAADQTDIMPDSGVDEEVTDSLADLQIEEEYVDDQGRIIGRARDESGIVVEDILDDEGNILDLNVPEETEARGDEDADEVDATDAARRKAGELGVRLSDVGGTGSGGRVLVTDVEKAARRSATDSA